MGLPWFPVTEEHKITTDFFFFANYQIAFNLLNSELICISNLKEHSKKFPMNMPVNLVTGHDNFIN